MAAIVMPRCVEGYGITISNYPQHTKYIHVFDAVWKDRGHHSRVAQHKVLKVHGMLSAFVKYVEIESGKV
jgi:hypothetical protein